MIRLNTTTRSLRAFLAGAITTSQLPITVGYSDGTTANYSGAAQLTLTNSATPVTICAAPAASTIRDIDYIAVSNTDTAAATVTVQVNDNGTFYEQVKATLQPGRQLVYTHAQGWNVGPTDATPLPASPTASVGLAAVNGTASTYMRSDAAPALSQAISPTWSGNHTFSNPITGSVTGSSGSTTGNAATATALQTARTINGVSFDGTANITIPGANPTGTVGLAAVNGVAATFMRSDGAPVLSQAITPTWTGAHIFSNTVALNAGVTLGDASGDALTINSNTASIPNNLNFSTGKVGIGGAPVGKLSVVTTSSGGSTTGAWDAAVLVVSPNATSSTGAALAFGYNTGGSGESQIMSLQPSVAWKSLNIYSAGLIFSPALGIKSAEFGTDGHFHMTAGKFYPSAPTAVTQSNTAIYGGSGAPNNANGADGDIYFRSDGGALTTIYQRRAGAWVGII